MINQIIKEIDVNIENKNYISALSMALILPDICGKAEFPNKKNKKRYIDWYEKYIGIFEKKFNSINDGSCYLSGDIVYNLRCNILHEGNPGIKNGMVDYFELVKTDLNRARVFMISISEEPFYIGDGEWVRKNIFSIGVHYLVSILRNVAEKYYNLNKEKFNFYQYNFVDIDRETMKAFKIKD